MRPRYVRHVVRGCRQILHYTNLRLFLLGYYSPQLSKISTVYVSICLRVKTNMLKSVRNTNFLSPCVFFQVKNAPKPIFGRGCARIPLGELTTLQRPASQMGWGHPVPILLPSTLLASQSHLLHSLTS